jgi:hypothetical protein
MKRLRLLLGLLLGALVAAVFVGLQWGVGLSAPAAAGSGAALRSAEAQTNGATESAFFMGLVWLDGTEPPMGTLVQAFVGGTECGESRTTIGGNVAGQWPGGFIGRAMYLMSVRSSNVRPGCGTEGATIAFSIDGREAHQTGQWKSRESQVLHLTIGAQPAIFSGAVTIDGGPVDRDIPIQALIGGVLCGDLRVAHDSEPPLMKESEYRHLAVLPGEARAGCGTEGAQIRFLVKGIQAKETAVWEPGFHTLDLLITTAPEETATATATATAVPTPTATPWPSPTITPTPKAPPVTGGTGGDGSNLPWLAVVVAGGVAASISAAAFVVLRSRR